MHVAHIYTLDQIKQAIEGLATAVVQALKKERTID